MRTPSDGRPADWPEGAGLVVPREAPAPTTTEEGREEGPGLRSETWDLPKGRFYKGVTFGAILFHQFQVSTFVFDTDYFLNIFSVEVRCL